MPYIKDYIKKYGKLSFNDMSFTDADNVAMCYMYYMPLEQVVSDSFDDEPVPFSVACNKLFALRDYKHKAVGLILLKDISVQMMSMASQRRFAQMKVVACTNVFGEKPAVQFNAATFLLPNGEIVVLFRGTDDTFTGWKEDFDILLKDSIPSHKLATQYLEQVAAKFDGNIIVCGHSKGGYVAQYGALNCKKEVRDRIKLLYNNDGPGFANYDFISSDAYKEMLPKYRHFVPQSSMIGMMLCHDDDYQIVRSKRITGPLQHDLSTWQIDGDTVKTVKDLTPLGKVNDIALYNLVSNLTEDEGKAFDEVLSQSIDNGKPVGLLDLKGNIVDVLKDERNVIENIDKDTLNQFKKTMHGMGDVISNAGRAVIKGEFNSVEDRIKK